MLQSDWYGAPDEYAYVNTLYTHFIIPRTCAIRCEVDDCGAFAYIRLLLPYDRGKLYERIQNMRVGQIPVGLQRRLHQPEHAM